MLLTTQARACCRASSAGRAGAWAGHGPEATIVRRLARRGWPRCRSNAKRVRPSASWRSKARQRPGINVPTCSGRRAAARAKRPTVAGLRRQLAERQRQLAEAVRRIAQLEAKSLPPRRKGLRSQGGQLEATGTGSEVEYYVARNPDTSRCSRSPSMPVRMRTRSSSFEDFPSLDAAKLAAEQHLVTHPAEDLS